MASPKLAVVGKRHRSRRRPGIERVVGPPDRLWLEELFIRAEVLRRKALARAIGRSKENTFKTAVGEDGADGCLGRESEDRRVTINDQWNPGGTCSVYDDMESGAHRRTEGVDHLNGRWLDLCQS